jgi:hypothetical protein
LAHQHASVILFCPVKIWCDAIKAQYAPMIFGHLSQMVLWSYAASFAGGHVELRCVAITIVGGEKEDLENPALRELVQKHMRNINQDLDRRSSHLSSDSSTNSM